MSLKLHKKRTSTDIADTFRYPNNVVLEKKSPIAFSYSKKHILVDTFPHGALEGAFLYFVISA